MEKSIFYCKLKLLSEQYGKSLNQIEREVGLPRNALNNYKLGGEPSAERTYTLAVYFGVSMEFLLGKENQAATVESYFKNLSLNNKVQMWKICQDWFEKSFKEET